METHARSIAKAVSYRFLGSAVTFAVAFVITRKVDLAVGIGVVDTVMKIGAFYIHERLWNHLPFGKQPPSDYQI